jgi:EpsD family peptidyl-prolyl cis-trans isomerase
MRFARFLSVVLLVSFLSGCREEQSDAGKLGETGQRDENVLAMIGDEAVTQEQLDAALRKLPPHKQKKFRGRVLDNLIEAKVFSQEARQAGLDKDPEIKKAVDKATNDVLARNFIKTHLGPQAQPSEEEITNHYQEHEDEFVVPEGVMIQHILVKRREQAEGILKELKEGASFVELAKKKSIAQSWKQGGQLGWLYKGRMEPALEKVAFDLEKEKLSDVIQTEKGYQIIKVLDRSDKRKIGLDEAKARIRSVLSFKKKKELFDKYYEEAKVDRDPSEKGVLVKVGDEVFTEETLAAILANVPEKERDKVKQRWIKYFIESTVFAEEARKVGLQDDLEVAKELEKITDRILANAFRKKFITDKFPVTDNDVANYYQSNLAEFRVPVKIRVRSIVVKTKEEAEKVVQELKEGKDFGYLAQQRSIQPSASKREGRGWLTEGKMDPAVAKVAASLDLQQVSDIIRTEAGYEIVKLLAKKGGDIRPLEEVTASIKMTLANQRFAKEKQRYYEKAGVEVFGS